MAMQDSVPPVMAFHLGSLGFLTPFKFDTYQSQVTQIIEGIVLFLQQTLEKDVVFFLKQSLFVVGNAAIVLRSRLKVRVHREKEKGIILTNGEVDNSRKAANYQVMSAPLIANHSRV